MDTSNQNLNKSLGMVEQQSGKTGSALGAVAKIAAGFIVAQALIKLPSYISSAVDAAKEAEASQLRLQNAVVNTGVSWDKYSSIVDNAVKSSKDLGFSGADARSSLSTLAAQTGDTDDAIRRLALAQDLARGTGMDLTTASRLLGKVTDENVTALQRYGIRVEAGSTATDLFAAVYEKFHGQASTFAESTAGKMERLSIKMGELKEQIGKALLPIMVMMVDFALNHVVPVFQHIATVIGTEITRAIDIFREAWEKARVKVQEFLDLPFVQNLKDMTTGLDGSAVAAGGLAGILSAALLPNLLNIIGAVGTVIQSVAVMSATVAVPLILFAALGAGLVVAYEKSDKFKAKVDDTAASLLAFGKSIGPAIEGFAKSVVPTIENLSHLFSLGFSGGGIGGQFTLVEKAAFGLGKTVGVVVAAFKAAIPVISDVVHLFAVGLSGGSIGGQFSLIEKAAFGLGKVLHDFLPPAMREIKKSWETEVQPALLAFYDIIATVVGAIKDNWPTIGPIIERALQYVGSQIEGVVQAFHGFIEIVSGVVQAVDDLIHGRWTQAWTDLGLVANGALDLFIGTMKALFGFIPGIISDAATSAATAAYAFGQGIVDSIVGAITDAISAVSDAFNGVVAFVSSIPGMAAQAFGAAESAVGDFISFIGEQLSAENLGKAVGGTIFAPIYFGRKALEALIPAVIEFFTSTLPSAVVGALGALVSAGIALGTAVIGAVASGVSSGGDAVKTFFTKTLPGFITETIPDAVTAALDFGAKIVNGIIDGLKGQPGAVKEGGRSLLTDLFYDMTDLVGMFAGIGKSIWEGIKQGITDAWNAAAGWVQDFFGGVYDSMKKAIVGGSPAQAFVPIGEMIAQGVGLGITNGWAAMNGDISKLVGQSVQIGSMAVTSSYLQGSSRLNQQQLGYGERAAFLEGLQAFLKGTAVAGEWTDAYQKQVQDLINRGIDPATIALGLAGDAANTSTAQIQNFGTTAVKAGVDMANSATKLATSVAYASASMAASASAAPNPATSAGQENRQNTPGTQGTGYMGPSTNSGVGGPTSGSGGGGVQGNAGGSAAGGDHGGLGPNFNEDGSIKSKYEQRGQENALVVMTRDGRWVSPYTFAAENNIPLSMMHTTADGKVEIYHKGTDFVSRTGLAMLQKGEAVIPASLNSPMLQLLKQLVAQPSSVTTDRSMRIDNVTLNLPNVQNPREFMDYVNKDLQRQLALANRGG